MARQAKFLREGIEDQLILEQAKGADGLTREQLAERIVVPRHTDPVQYFPLYVLPVIVIVIGYFFFSLLAFCKSGARQAGHLLIPLAEDVVFPDYQRQRR